MSPELHQGSGLLGFMPEPGARLLPVLSHPQATIELELLWQLAEQLRRLGYPVLVLDGTAGETADAPGLAHWLAAGSGPRGNSGTALTVVPAATGLREEDALQWLAPLLPRDAVVLLYATPTDVAPLLQGAWATPLVLVGPDRAALLRSYTLLKQMAALGPWRCTALALRPPGSTAQASDRALQALRQGGMQWLGASPHGLAANLGDADALEALALQLLENACPLAPPDQTTAAGPHPGAPRYHGQHTH